MRPVFSLAFALSTVFASAATASTPQGARTEAQARLEALARAHGAAPKVVWRKGRGMPSVVTGRLSAPSTRAPLAIANTFLRDNAALLRAPVDALALEQQTSLPSGTSVLRYAQRHEGLPVFDASVTVTVDATGVVRVLNARAFAMGPVSVTPRLDAGAALRAAQRAVPFSAPTEETRRATLGYIKAPGALRLTWRVELPAIPALLSAPTLYIDASNGRVLRRTSRIFFAKRGKVYRGNPVSTPTVTTEDFPWLADGATTLETPRVKALNCVDRNTTSPVSFGGMRFNVHLCEEIHKAAANGSGDFVADPILSGDGRDEDDFAEQMMFYHAHRIYDFFRTLGFETLTPSRGSNPQLHATANFRIPIDFNNIPQNILEILQLISNPNGMLFPFDNAFFLAAEAADGFLQRSADSLVFGQGVTADYAYDGDVIYHEFGHAVVRSTAKLDQVIVDDFGLDGAPGAMNEGYADYFAAALSGDAKVGEHVGRSLPAGMIADSIRDLENTETCPNGLWGEVHNDSLPFTGALWEARKGVAAGDRAKFDRAVYTALLTLNGGSDFEEAAAATVTALRTELGATTATAAETLFARRGLNGCANRIVEGGGPRRVTIVEGTGSVEMDPFVPGYTQLKVRTTAGRTKLVISMTEGRAALDPRAGVGGLTGGGPDLRVILLANAPIQFAFNDELSVIDNAGDFTELTLSGRMVGNQRILSAEHLGNVDTDYHVMLVNKGQGQGVVANFKVELAAAPAPDGGVRDAGVPSAPDAGVASDAGVSPPAKSSGCSAGAGAPESALTIWLALLAILFAARRRRA